MRRVESQVFIDSELKTRILVGPFTFNAWSASFQVFRAAMLMLEAASPQILDDYHESIRELTILHPNSWGVIYIADEMNRSEQWDAVKEACEDEETVLSSSPWNDIIARTTLGKAIGEDAHWWWTHVTAPCLTPGAAGAKVKMLEGSVDLNHANVVAPQAGSSIDHTEHGTGSKRCRRNNPRPAHQPAQEAHRPKGRGKGNKGQGKGKGKGHGKGQGKWNR